MSRRSTADRFNEGWNSYIAGKPTTHALRIGGGYYQGWLEAKNAHALLGKILPSRLPVMKAEKKSHGWESATTMYGPGLPENFQSYKTASRIYPLGIAAILDALRDSGAMCRRDLMALTYMDGENQIKMRGMIIDIAVKNSLIIKL